MNDLLDIKIHFDKKDACYTLGECLKGEIILVPGMDLDINYFSYDIMLELRGQLEQYTDVNQTIYLIKNKQLKAGESYRYPIEWVVSEPTTYEGGNAEFLWKLVTNIRFNDGTRRAIKNKYLKTLSLYKAISYEKKLKREQYIKVESGKYAYQVEKQSDYCEPSYFNKNLGLTIFLVAFFMLFLLSLKTIIFDIIFPFVIGVLLLYTAVFLFHYFYIYLVFGSARLTISPINDAAFDMRFDVEKNAKQISKAMLFYQIGETVVDRRGTSVTTHHSVLFKSDEKIVKGHNRALYGKMTYPDERYPVPIELKDVSIYWEAVLSFRAWFGLRFEYKKRFRIIKKELENQENN